MKHGSSGWKVLLAAGLGFAGASRADVVPPNEFNVQFSAYSDLAAPCTMVGRTSDRDCSKALALDNGALDATAKFSVNAQASADASWSYGDLQASATIPIHYVVPFVVTRTVNVARVGSQYIAVMPELSLKFTYHYSAVAATRDEAEPGSERADVGELTLTLTDSTPWIVGAVGQSGNAGQLNRNPVSGDETRSRIISAGPSVGEVSTLADIPLSMNMWSDELSPFVDYAANHSFLQTYSGTISVETSLYAFSRSKDYWLGGNGGEAIACFGSRSGLSGFELDDFGCPAGFEFDWPPVDNGGLSVSAALTQTGIALERIGPVPEPGSALLLSAGLGGLLLWRLRRAHS